MKQKLLIAIALGRDAQVLIMDEPAANLDPEARKIFFDLLAERVQNATMLISSHRLDEVSALVNRVVELDMGRVVLDETMANEASLARMCTARVSCRQPEPALAKALGQWNFRALDDAGTSWKGEIAGPTACASSAPCRATSAVVSDLNLTEDRP